MTQQTRTLTLTRREFTKTALLSLGALSVSPGAGLAHASPQYQRMNVTSAGGTASLKSYKQAIRAMLALPPTDPRNWYRHALVHTLDCPHGNWWFLPWHRAYIGWFERICRELSGDANFALPYWDWTENLNPSAPFRPGVPALMFDDVLTPTHSAYIASFKQFYGTFEDVITKSDYWKPVFDGSDFVSSSEFGQLLARSIRFPQDLWFDINDDPRGKIFFPIAQARGLTIENPYFDEKTTKAVSLTTLLDALSPRDFITFASPKTQAHSSLTGFSVLEGQPHNRVHNCVGGILTDANGVTTDSGGFMQAFLSPVDPLFFLHHANVDRLWDVWTRKQEARGYPILPDGYLHPRRKPTPPFTDYEVWSEEPFVFFVDSNGQPVKEAKAGDYAKIGDFSYEYQPGSGEDIVSAAARFGATAHPTGFFRQFNVPLTSSIVAASQEGQGVITLPQSLIDATRHERGVLLAKITLAMPANAQHVDYKVVVNGPESIEGVGPTSPYYAGTLSVFGHHTIHCPVTFAVPLTGPLSAMRASVEAKGQTTLNIRIFPEGTRAPRTKAAMAMTSAAAEVISIAIEVH